MTFLEIFDMYLVVLVLFCWYLIIFGQYLIIFGQNVVNRWLIPRKSSRGGSTDRVTQANQIDMAIYIYIYNQGLLGRVLGGGPTHPTECHPFGEVPWTLQILVLSRLLPRFPLGTQKYGKLPPQGTPKWPQSHSNTCGWIPQNTWYLQHGSHIGPLRRELDHPLCFCVSPGAYFFKFSVTFADFGGQIGVQNGVLFSPAWAPSGIISRQGAHKWP